MSEALPLPSPFDDPGWLRALSLGERLELCRRLPVEAEDASQAAGADARSASLPYRRWREQQPFSDDELFARRLEADGVTEEEFRRALTEPPESLATALEEPPPWLAELASAFSQAPDTQAPPPAPGEPEAALIALAEPLLVAARSRIERRVAELVREYPRAPIHERTAVRLLLGTMPPGLLQKMRRTLILELNVARVQGELEGADGAERFWKFIDRLRSRREAARVLAEYPVLARSLAEEVVRREEVGVEMLRHLCEDWEAIEATFGAGPNAEVLEDIGPSSGDVHRGGRSVRILRFDSGRSLVYKPRSLAVERHFQELLGWVEQRADVLPFRALAILDRGDHGWVERVEALPCESRAEVERYYRRQGAYLALLYMLQANDFHFENLIAAGEHPVLVDLESLFQQHLASFDETADGRASSVVAQSVVRVGLLPRRAWISEGFGGVDLSGLGADEGQELPDGLPVTEEAGTDRMRLTRRPRTVPAGSHRPVLDGQVQAATDFAEEIERGFEATYRALERHRAELTSAGGPLEAFADDEVRVILRSTRPYGLMLSDAYHPRLLREGLDRSRHFDRLWVGVESRPDRAPVIPAELEEIEAGDIPCFSTRPGGRSLVNGAGHPVPRTFDSTGLELVGEGLERFGDADLERQIWLIRSSLRIARSTAEMRARRPLPAGLAPPSADRLVALARRVGDRLDELALGGEEGEVTWIGLFAEDERHFVPNPLGSALYGGVTGVALFLAHLAEVTGGQRYRSLAEGAWRTAEAQLDAHGDRVDSVGAFNGWGGMLYVAAHLASLWSRPELLERMLARCLDRLPDLIDRDRTFDMVSGVAGCLLSLLGLDRGRPSPRVLEVARRCGEHLAEHAFQAGAGVGWSPNPKSQPPLTGLSHGVAGVAWALYELALVTGDLEHRRLAERALAYERGLYSSEAQNWPDLRSFVGTDEFSAAWCHGAAGIGLARLRILEAGVAGTERGPLVDEVRRAVETTLRDGFGSSHCLCHGDLGNLEIVTEAARVLADDSWRRRAGELLGGIVERLDAEGFYCGVPGGLETPGLMDGIAGIGLGLLRLAAPDRVPSVLFLEPPAGSGAARYDSPRSETTTMEVPA